MINLAAILAFLTGLIAFIGLIIGYVMNVFDLIGMSTSGAAVDTLFIVRVIGLFVAPLGGVMGWF